jgi:nonsense-mediated mRNA decay protein 3
MHVLDPSTLQGAVLSSTLFWRYPFKAICAHGGYTEFMILDIEPLRDGAGELIRLGKVQSVVISVVVTLCHVWLVVYVS